jgi:2-polyprenyl-6-methoxyphenol hydroxylase-like FAD-dependent oxidoreductase
MLMLKSIRRDTSSITSGLQIRTFTKKSILKTQVCIVGAGPVGMVLSKMLSKFGVDNVLLEKKDEMQSHPKAHYLSFRTSEILADLGLHKELVAQLDHVNHWNHFSYTRGVLSEPFS